MKLVTNQKVANEWRKFYDSFDTNETFLQCAIFRSERKVICNILPVVSVSIRNVFFKVLLNVYKTCKKKYFYTHCLETYFFKESINESRRTVELIISSSEFA